MARPEEYVDWFPLKGSDTFQQYKRGNEIDLGRLELEFLDGRDRGKIKATPLVGSYSLYLSYKGRAGAVTSFGDAGEDFAVVQVQGCTQEGYIIDRDLKWIALMASQSLLIVSHGESPYKMLVMEDYNSIKGVENALLETSFTNPAIAKYQQFIAVAALRFSQEEGKFIRDIR